MAYITGWSSIIELQDGQTVSNNLDSAFGLIDTSFLDIEARLDTIQPQVIDTPLTYGKRTDLVASNAGYVEVARVPYSIKKGDVIFGYSLTISGTQGDKLYLEFAIDGINFTEHIVEIKDSVEERPTTYLFPKPIETDVLSDFVVRVKTGSTDNNIDIHFLDVIILQSNVS